MSAPAAGEPITVEATGETVGEAKWLALRELEKLAPEADKAAVQFEVVAEGERGLLGVGYAPARVIARLDPSAARASPAARVEESDGAARVRELVERIVSGLGLRSRVDVQEDEEGIVVQVSGGDLGLLIGRHGQTIDAVQYLVNAIVFRDRDDSRKPVTVDAAGYRERRRSWLESLALRTAERVRSSGEPVELEPMTATERRIVHLRLQEEEGVATRSEGQEPHRYVVVVPG